MRYSIIFPVALLAGSQFALALPVVTKPSRGAPKPNDVAKTQGTSSTRSGQGSNTQGGAAGNPPNNVETNTQGQVGEPARNSEVVGVSKTQPLVDMVGGGFGTPRNSGTQGAPESLPAVGAPHNTFGGGDTTTGGGQGSFGEGGTRKRSENRARGLKRRSRVQARFPQIYGDSEDGGSTSGAEEYDDSTTSQVPPPAVGNPQSSNQGGPNQVGSPSFDTASRGGGNGKPDATGGLPSLGGSERGAGSHESAGEAPLPNEDTTGGGAGNGGTDFTIESMGKKI